MTNTTFTRIGWKRISVNEEDMLINGATGTKFDAKGFDHWGFNEKGLDADGTYGEDDDWYGFGDDEELS
jgi:hypothetical protein